MMKDRGEYQTKQRLELLNYLKQNAARHITAAQLHQAMQENGTPMSTATIYRLLERFTECGLVCKYTLDERGSACWQYLGRADLQTVCQAHFHMKCTRCGTLIHLDCDHLRDIAAHLQTDHGFQIDPTRTVFYGLCSTCAKEEAEE